MRKRRGWLWRGNYYGVELATEWPHISLGISAHAWTRFAHLTLHLPFGLVIIGCIGADDLR